MKIGSSCLARLVFGSPIAITMLSAGMTFPAWGVPEQADLILHNGKVVTVDFDFSIQSAVVATGGKIVEVGREDIIRKYRAGRVIDLKGRVLLPGFTDTHVHIITKGHRDVDLSNASSISELQNLVRAKAREMGTGNWVTGMAWDETRFSEKRNPVRSDIDVAAPDNPVMLVRAGGHSAVFNSAALKLLNVTRHTTQPADGLIEKGTDGELNGIIRESWADYAKIIPPLPWSEVRESYIAELKRLLTLGITSLMEASGSIEDEPVGAGGIASPKALGTYHQVSGIYAEQAAVLPRMSLYISYPGAKRLTEFRHRTGFGDEYFRIGPIGESFVDGGFTGPTAWTLVDYKGMPGFRGKGRYTDEQIQEMVDTSAKLGWQMGLHAIGDAAIVQAVNAYARTLEVNNGVAGDRRWFLCHFTVMPPDTTMAKMALHHIRIAQQPNFTYTLEDRYVATLDDWRVQHTNSVATPWKKYGLFVAFGSDNLPVGPMVGLYTAITRKGRSGQVYGAEEAVSIRDALRMYTANGPYLTFEEKVKGTIEPGKLADMIVLDTDPLSSEPEALLKTQVDFTIIGGRVVYERLAHVSVSRRDSAYSPEASIRDR